MLLRIQRKEKVDLGWVGVYSGGKEMEVALRAASRVQHQTGESIGYSGSIYRAISEGGTWESE